MAEKLSDEKLIRQELLDKAISAAIDGDAVLFLGSGVGVYSLDQDGNKLPTGSQLSEEISRELSLDEINFELPRVAQYFRRKRGAYELLKLLKRRLDVKTVDPRYQELLELPWKRIYTTNYDNTVEFVRNHKNAHSIKSDPKNINNGDCVHLNGYINTVNLENLDDSVILTDWNYANSNLYGTPWANFFRNDIVSTSYVLFVGYSMRDLDIARIISLTGDAIKKRIIIIVSEKTSDIDIEVLGEYGVVFTEGAEYAIIRQKYAKKRHQKIDNPYLYSSISEMNLSFDYNSVSDISKLLYDQLVYGIVQRETILSRDEADGSVKLFFDRENIKEAMQRAVKGEISAILITGGVATGKTYATLQIEKFFLNSDIKVFRVNNARNLKQDLFNAAKNLNRVAFIFENYQDYISEIEYLIDQNVNNHIIILTARTAVHELYGQWIEKVFHYRYLVCDLERLSVAEISDLDLMLNHAGLWSDLAGWKPERRIDYVRARFESC